MNKLSYPRWLLASIFLFAALVASSVFLTITYQKLQDARRSLNNLRQISLHVSDDSRFGASKPFPRSLVFGKLQDSVIVARVSGSDASNIQNQWASLPDDMRDLIESRCLKLGLSSTGRIELVDVYQQIENNKTRRYFHFVQKEVGARLFWSILIDPDAERYRVLFDINERPTGHSQWQKLAG